MQDPGGTRTIEEGNMGWVDDEGRLEFQDRLGRAILDLGVARDETATALLDRFFHAAACRRLAEEDLGRLVRLLATRRPPRTAA